MNRRSLGMLRSLPAVTLLLSASAGTLSGCADSGLAGSSFTGDESLLDFVNFGGGSSPEALINAALNGSDADERQRGITRIAAQPFGAEPGLVQLYRLGIEDEDAAVRTASARALGLHGTPEDAAALANVLRSDSDRLARWQAAIALQRLHNPVAVGDLIAATREGRADRGRGETDVQVRAAAAIALGQYAEPRVLDALIAALDDPDLAVNAGARRSLRVLTGHDAGYLPRDWFTWLRNTESPFADRDEFLYPVYARDALWWERINPFSSVPNEIAARPVGMPAVGRR